MWDVVGVAGELPGVAVSPELHSTRPGSERRATKTVRRRSEEPARGFAGDRRERSRARVRGAPGRVALRWLAPWGKAGKDRGDKGATRCGHEPGWLRDLGDHAAARVPPSPRLSERRAVGRSWLRRPRRRCHIGPVRHQPEREGRARGFVVAGSARLGVASASGSGVYSAAGERLGAAIPVTFHRFAFTLTGDVLGTLHPFQLRLEERLLLQTGTVTGAVQAGFSAFL